MTALLLFEISLPMFRHNNGYTPFAMRSIPGRFENSIRIVSVVYKIVVGSFDYLLTIAHRLPPCI